MIGPHDYPELFRPRFWFGTTDVQFKLLKAPPQSHLIANVNVVPRCGDGWLMVFAEDWQTWEMPGGTLEPDEHYLQAIKRELMEEAGATPTSRLGLGAVTIRPTHLIARICRTRFFTVMLLLAM